MSQMDLSQYIEGAETYEIKPLIYSLSACCFKTVCPYCKMDNPNSTDPEDCTKRYYVYRENPQWYPYLDKPFDYCPRCGKRFDTNCEVRFTKQFAALNEDYIKRLRKDSKGRWREYDEERD